MKEKQPKKRLKKPKKFTVKFFLNEAVQPIMEGRTKRYPLYALLTYDRKNTMMRCHYGNYYKDLKEIDKVHYPGLIDMEERIIRKIAEYEIIQRGDDFDLKGIHRKYEQYCIGIHVVLGNHLKGQLWNILLRLEPFEFLRALNFADPDVEFDTLYKMSRKLYKEFSSILPKNFEREVESYQEYMKLYQGSFFQYAFPTVIEWLDGSMVEDYRTKLAKHHSETPANISASVEFMDKIIRQEVRLE